MRAERTNLSTDLNHKMLDGLIREHFRDGVDSIAFCDCREINFHIRFALSHRGWSLPNFQPLVTDDGFSGVQLIRSG